MSVDQRNLVKKEYNRRYARKNKMTCLALDNATYEAIYEKAGLKSKTVPEYIRGLIYKDLGLG